MAWSDFFAALGLVLILEGILPFASPSGWRNMVQQISATADKNLRSIGAVSMIAGLLILYFARS